MKIAPVLQRALEYIEECGGSIRIQYFDEDNQNGAQLRKDLVEQKLAVEKHGKIQIVSRIGFLEDD
jgi:hypothetical protein